MNDYAFTYNQPRPELAVLRYINPADFGPRHLELLQRLEANSWDGTTAARIAYRIAMQEVWMWEVGEDNAPIVLTSIQDTEQGRVLFLDGAAGVGIVKNAEAIVSDLHLIAGFYGASRIRALSEREGFKSLPDLFNFQPVATVWELEVDDGRRRSEEPNDDAEG